MGNESLKACVLQRIEREGVCPRPRVWFQTRECVVWTLWLISVVIGALAVAVTLSALVIRRYALFEVTHGSFWWSLATALPYLWLVAFAGMVVFAVYNIRHTKRGYRYPLGYIIASSVVVSGAVGLGLHLAGLGFLTDTLLGDRIAVYQSQQKYERQLWQQPSQGRLVATLVALTDDPEVIIMRDGADQLWSVDVREIAADDHALLTSGALVKVLGLVTDSAAGEFLACGSAPWYFNKKSISASELLADRDSFWQRVRRHRRGVEQETYQATQATGVIDSHGEPHCGQLGFLHSVSSQ